MNSQNYFILGKNITKNITMMNQWFFFRGKKYVLRFYMPHKPTKWGFKIHSMVDSKSNFLYDIIFDAGKEWKKIINPETDKSCSRAIVNTLVDKLPKTGYHLFFDSWYSSIELLTDLNEKGYFYTTTLKPNNKNFPDKNKIEKSSLRKYVYNNTNNLLIQQYNDKKTIYFATNYEDTTSKIRNIYYFENRGVDKLNQYISYNSLDRKVNKWWKKLFFLGIEVSSIKFTYFMETFKR